MCFTLENTSKVETAQEDITVYKRLGRRGDVAYSPYMGYEYKLGGTYAVPNFSAMGDGGYEVEFSDTIPEGVLSVFKGFHSYTTQEEARRHWITHSLFRCTIPKGTLFIRNDDMSEIVSLALRVDERIF
jgi:hypothetical protein